MIISPDSPLRRIPDNLDSRQACFLDGIRLSAEMADISYERLAQRLFELACSFGEGVKLETHDAAELLMQAWTIVDSVHRLRSVLQAMPKMQKSGPIFQLFLRATNGVTKFRNIIQHLQQNLPEMADKNWPVWGVLTWLAVIRDDGTLIRSCSLNAGRLQSGSHHLLNPAGMQFQARLDHVTLQVQEERVGLSDYIRQIGKVIVPIEQALAKQFPDVSTCGSGIMVCVDMSFAPGAPGAAGAT